VRCSQTGRILVTSRAAYRHTNRRQTRDGIGRVLLPDFGRLLTDGAIALTGRDRGFLKRAGRRIGLGEVETIAREVPGVRHAWAAAIRLGSPEELMALAVESDLSVGDVRSALKERLPNWKCPTRILCLKTFPVTQRGKFATAELERMLSAGRQMRP